MQARLYCAVLRMLCVTWVVFGVLCVCWWGYCLPLFRTNASSSLFLTAPFNHVLQPKKYSSLPNAQEPTGVKYSCHYGVGGINKAVKTLNVPVNWCGYNFYRNVTVPLVYIIITDHITVLHIILPLVWEQLWG